MNTFKDVPYYREENVDCYLLPSIKAVAKYGIPKHIALHMQHTYWVISREYRAIFKSYYILKWHAAYFTDKLHNGTITREGVTYQVLYHRTGSIPANSPVDTQVLLSFRELQPEYDAVPVVLVTVA